MEKPRQGKHRPLSKLRRRRSLRLPVRPTVALLAAAAVVACGYFYQRPGPPIAKLQTPKVFAAHTKAKRAITPRLSKRVCVIPKGHLASCTAKIAVNSKGVPLTGTPTSLSGYGPQQFHTAYNLPCTPGGAVASICSAPSSYGPETIAIVDAGNFDTGTSGLESSLQAYDQYYGLPSCTIANSCLTVVNQSGSTSPLPVDAGWSDEIALDVETAHMICQTCKIVLVEANDAYGSDLAAADDTAATFNPVSISNSWGSNVDDSAYDTSFEHPGIAVVAATGDNGTVSSGASWPSDIPDVVAASGTTLQLYADNTWSSETVWSGSGGGCSNYYSAPTWQSSLSNWGTAGCGSYRAFGDLSADANPSTGAAVNIDSNWYQIGGTSLSTPIIASIFALTGGVSSGTVASSLPYADFTSSNSHDITSGNDCTTTNTTYCTAGTGFDMPSGLGSPNGISGFVSMPTPPSLTATTVNQTEVSLSWTASSASAGINDYRVYRNGSQIATATSTNYTDTGLTPNTTYTYYVVAYDTNGNASPASVNTNAFTAYAADINEDGHINLLDLSLLANKYGQSGSNLGRADINGDGTVNLLDLSLLANGYGTE